MHMGAEFRFERLELWTLRSAQFAGERIPWLDAEPLTGEVRAESLGLCFEGQHVDTLAGVQPAICRTRKKGRLANAGERDHIPDVALCHAAHHRVERPPRPMHVLRGMAVEIENRIHDLIACLDGRIDAPHTGPSRRGGHASLRVGGRVTRSPYSVRHPKPSTTSG